jgi:hypothetical protein
MIFTRAALDLLTFVSTLDSSIVPGVNAFAGGVLPAVGVAPLRCWFFSEGQSRLQQSSGNSGLWQIEIQILLRGQRNRRRETDEAVNALAEQIYNVRGFASEQGAAYSCVRPSTFAPRPIDLGVDETDSELSSLNVELWLGFG